MQTATATLVRDNISNSVATEVRNMIVDGRLREGERINEVHLSRQLGVSRTPLREALAALEHEGAITSVPRIGCFVRPLTMEEFEQIYDIRPLLDPEALRLAGLPSREKLARLREIEDKIERQRDADTIIDLDDAWHRELVAACPNKVLLGLIEEIIRRTRRYEIALMRERKNVLTAFTGHRAILAELARGNLERACEALKDNMVSGRKPIVAWLKAREAKGRRK